MFKVFLMGLAVLGLVLAQGCATTGPATVINPASGQVVDVPSGNRVIVVTPGDPTLRSSASSDVYRHIENMANINQRANADQLRYQAEKDRNQSYLQQSVVREASQNLQTRQRERTYRSQNLQRTVSDLTRSYYSSQSQKIYSAPRKSAPRPIFFPRPR